MLLELVGNYGVALFAQGFTKVEKFRLNNSQTASFPRFERVLVLEPYDVSAICLGYEGNESFSQL